MSWARTTLALVLAAVAACGSSTPADDGGAGTDAGPAMPTGEYCEGGALAQDGGMYPFLVGPYAMFCGAGPPVEDTAVEDARCAEWARKFAHTGFAYAHCLLGYCAWSTDCNDRAGAHPDCTCGAAGPCAQGLICWAPDATTVPTCTLACR